MIDFCTKGGLYDRCAFDIPDDLGGRAFDLSDRVPSRPAVQQNVQLGDFRDPAPVHLAVELDCELHGSNIAPLAAYTNLYLPGTGTGGASILSW